MAKPSSAADASVGRRWTIAGIVCGVLTLVLPIVFGPLGIIFGYVGRKKGATSLGTAAIGISAVLLVLVVVIGAVAGALGALA